MNKRKIQSWLVLAPIVLAVGMLVGCATKTAPIWGDPQTGIILQYRMPEGQALKYETREEARQTLDVMGRTIETDAVTTSSITARSNGQKESNHQLTVTIDGMSIKIQSPQSDLEPDMSTVVGKSFDMVLSPLGKEVELLGAEAIEYDMGPEGKRNIAAGFKDFFPNLADRPVIIGDSWPDETSVTEKTDSGELIVNLSAMNTLEGFETIDGRECVRISAEYTGTLEGKREEQGMELDTRGNIKGTLKWYFAYKEGIFVGLTNEGTAEGTIEIPSQGLQLPFTRQMKSGIDLIK